MTGGFPGSSDQAASALASCIWALSQAPSALVTDIDGTISEVAATPGEATVLPKAREALRRLQRSLAFVGVVTGRAASVGAAMVDLPGLVVVGNHGLERSGAEGVIEHPEAVRVIGAITEAVREIEDEMQARDEGAGVLYENKRLSATVHYRLAPDPTRALSVLVEVAGAIAERRRLRLTEGRFILELRPPVIINKGTAVSDLIREKQLRGIIVLGDDTTDVDAFLAVRDARETGTLTGIRVGVTAAETPPEVLAESDVTVPGVAACATLLTQLADHFERVSTNA